MMPSGAEYKHVGSDQTVGYQKQKKSTACMRIISHEASASNQKLRLFGSNRMEVCRSWNFTCKRSGWWFGLLGILVSLPPLASPEGGVVDGAGLLASSCGHCVLIRRLYYCHERLHGLRCCWPLIVVRLVSSRPFVTSTAHSWKHITNALRTGEVPFSLPSIRPQCLSLLYWQIPVHCTALHCTLMQSVIPCL